MWQIKALFATSLQERIMNKRYFNQINKAQSFAEELRAEGFYVEVEANAIGYIVYWK